jgi:type I restriction enzyme, S subunit
MTAESTVGELIETLIDYRGKTPPKTKSGVPLITAKVIKGGTILAEPREYVAEDGYGAWMRRGLPARGDILITTEAPLGEVARVSDPRIALAQRVILLRPDASKVDPSFLFHYLRSPQAQAALGRRSSGTTVSGIRQPELRAVEVPLLARSSQGAVGVILDAIDDLIENNRRRVEVLEEMARAIYREWFVKFRYPGHNNISLVDSALGPIPEGWNVSSLAAQAHITMGQSPKSDFYNDEGIGRPFHQGVTDFGQHFPSTRKWCSVDGRSAAAGDLLISVRAPVGRINIADTDVTIGRGLSAIRAKDGRQALLLGHLREAFAEEDTMGNDGAIFKSLGKLELAAVPVTVPPDEIADAGDQVLADNVNMIRALTQATQRLSSLRSLLLPKLVTGQIDVSLLDLDAAVGDQVA